MHDLLRNTEPSSLLDAHELEELVESSIGELELLVQQLSSIKDLYPVLDLSFDGLEKRKDTLCNILNDSPEQQIKDNYNTYIDLMTDCNEYVSVN